MRALDRLLLREARALAGPLLAIALVLASGIATFTMSRSATTSLTRTLEAFYEDRRFADVFTHVQRAPRAVADAIAAVEGVARVEARIAVDVTLDVPGLAEPAVGRAISVPPGREPSSNALHLRRGRWLAPGRPGEVLASEAFVQAHGMEPGARVRAVVNGRLETWTIVGVVLSPEFVYCLRAGEILPDDRRFGVFWAAEEELAAAFDLDGAWNDATIALKPGASEEEVVRRVDFLTAPYGGLGAYGRDEVSSHRLVSDELKQLRAMGLVTPAIFLLVAAFLVRVVVSRLVSTRREQIASLKAFGYARGEIRGHFIRLVLLVVVVGTGFGLVAGSWLGRDMTRLYARFFRFPEFRWELEPGLAVLALGIAVVVTVGGALGAVRKATDLPPAEAMRPESPARYRASGIERVGFGALLGPTGRMVARHLERHPARSALTCLGIAAATGVLVLGTFIEDVIDHVMDREFVVSQRQDATLGFVEPVGGRALSGVSHLPGVRAVEPMRAVACRLRHGHLSRRVAMIGLPLAPRLLRPLDEAGRPVAIPAQGVLLTDALATLLDLRPGDPLVVEVLEGERPVRESRVSAVVPSTTGLSAYMSLGAVHALLREDDVATGALLTLDGARVEELWRAVKELPRVSSVTVKQAMLDGFRRTFAENLLRMKAFMAIFAGVIAFGVVYNAVRISLAERSRELATLRVLGFTRGEVATILLGEVGALVAVAIPVGLALGRVGGELTLKALATESQRFPFAISPATYGYAALVTLIAALASAASVGRSLARLDLLAVLKARE